MLRNSFQCIVVVLATFYNCNGQLSRDIKFFEHGQHIEGEQISFTYNGIIPAFKPNYELNVTSQNEKLRHNFTYLRVEYYNLMSDVNIVYDAAKPALHFYIRFPFIATPIGVLGYALPE